MCMVCQRRPTEQVDHIIPVTKGGTDERSNLQGICLVCHEEKTRKDLGIKKKPVRISVKGYPIVTDCT